MQDQNYGEWSEDELLYALLRSEKALQHDNYLKYVNFATKSDLKERINHVRLMTAKLGNILTNKEQHEIASEMHRMENTKHTKTTRERDIIRLVKITNDLYNKQKQYTSRHHDQTYYGIKDIENLLEDEIDDYYEPILVRSSFDNNFEEYEIRGDKKKNLSIKEYIFIILTKLYELIDKKKKSTNDEQTV